MKKLDGCLQNNKKQIPQHQIFKCGMTHLNYSLKKLGKTFKLQKDFLKTQMNQDEIDENNWRDKKNQWVDYVQNDVLCNGFSYARYFKAMGDNTAFSMKDCLSLPGLGWKNFNNLRTKEDEPI